MSNITYLSNNSTGSTHASVNSRRTRVVNLFKCMCNRPVVLGVGSVTVILGVGSVTVVLGVGSVTVIPCCSTVELVPTQYTSLV